MPILYKNILKVINKYNIKKKILMNSQMKIEFFVFSDNIMYMYTWKNGIYFFIKKKT